jgi:hypothetical protein
MGVTSRAGRQELLARAGAGGIASFANETGGAPALAVARLAERRMHRAHAVDAGHAVEALELTHTRAPRWQEGPAFSAAFALPKQAVSPLALAGCDAARTVRQLTLGKGTRLRIPFEIEECVARQAVKHFGASRDAVGSFVRTCCGKTEFAASCDAIAAGGHVVVGSLDHGRVTALEASSIALGVKSADARRRHVLRLVGVAAARRSRCAESKRQDQDRPEMSIHRVPHAEGVHRRRWCLDGRLSKLQRHPSAIAASKKNVII